MNESTPSPESIIAIISAILIPVLAISVFLIICLWKVFVKAGKPGWAAIIPIYNTIVMIEIAGKPVWWIILMFIPLVSIVFAIWVLNLLCKSFGKGEGFTVGMIFLPFIFLPILAFGDAKYLGPAGAPKFQPIE